MTDARLPGYWLTEMRFMDMSDRAWRVFTSALMWSAEQGTDGRIPMRYARYLHPEGVSDDDVRALVDAGLAEHADDALQLIGWSDQKGLRQSTDEQVQHYRDRKRQNQAEYRKRRRATGHAPGDVTGYVPGHVGEGYSSREGPIAYAPGHVIGHTPARQLVTVQPGSDCGPGRHKLASDGTCLKCEYRPRLEEAS